MWLLVSVHVTMAVCVAMVAHSKTRSAVGWFFYGLLIWPVALTHALLLKQPTPPPRLPLTEREILARIEHEKAEAMTREGRAIDHYTARERAERRWRREVERG